ncbi:amidase [Rhizobium hainanense]|uniref:Indoleacetamide hydrolase n=1 Tax=Rhizobium hainanense TaxID=52131 RepID=A0A1C3W8V3_9HYPH|nr:amidase [Rhizobium hainanense]SCB36440.1 amidase [Rhizobium hainanense]
MSELHYMSLLDLTKRMHAGEISPVEVTKAQLQRIESLDPGLKSFALVTPELALKQAKAAEADIMRGDIKGPLHGAPIGLKDLCWTRGITTTGGMTLYADFKPPEDAAVTAKLEQAGTICLGKLKNTEGAYTDHHPLVTPPVNPWNAEHWSGVSSSGSGVATAAGLCFGSLGTDTGGSIRFPSAANGLTGLKPTWGRVSRYGVFELAATLDHVGPMTRSAADAAAMLSAIAGPDAKDPTAAQRPIPDYLSEMVKGLQGLKIGIDSAFNAPGLDHPTAAALSSSVEVIKALGGDIREVAFPDIEAVLADWLAACAAETAVAHEATYPGRKEEYGPGLAGVIDVGRNLSAMELQKVILRRNDFRGRVAAFFQDVDLLIVPAQSIASPTLDRIATLSEDIPLMRGLMRFTSIFNMSGNPTITLPCGFTEAGTPIAFQFVSDHWGEDKLFRAGYAFQQATKWHLRHPAM